jgi:pyridoxamine-phosphate oxidase
MDTHNHKLQVTDHRQYNTTDSLSPSSVSPCPLDQFRIWFSETLESGVVEEPEAMSLSTATASGIPSVRIVLFKQLDTRGFIFFTNYTSRKSLELLANPLAALVFYWREIHRSVRVLGKVEKISRQESEIYFKSRPLGSRLGAWASKQSSVVGEGEVHAQLEKIRARFGVKDGAEDADIPLPDFWGGWRVVPQCESFACRFLFEAVFDMIFVLFSVKLNFGQGNHLDYMIVFATSVSKSLHPILRSGK